MHPRLALGLCHWLGRGACDLHYIGNIVDTNPMMFAIEWTCKRIWRRRGGIRADMELFTDGKTVP